MSGFALVQPKGEEGGAPNFHAWVEVAGTTLEDASETVSGVPSLHTTLTCSSRQFRLSGQLSGMYLHHRRKLRRSHVVLEVR